MVKYGKQYREYQIQEWVQHYINYKALKQKIKYIRSKLPKEELVSNAFLNISNLNSMPLEPDKEIIEDQYLSPLYKLNYGNYLKEFIDLLNNEFHKFYIFFSNTEKQLYKQINMHLYAKDHYDKFSKKKIKSELNSLGVCIYLAKCLNCFINDNLMAMKKILKKFDKNFKNYFGLITPKYILSQISLSINDLDYVIQFKIIDEASCICEESAKILKKYYLEIGDNDNINKEKANDKDNNVEEIRTDFMQQYKELMLCVKEIDEVIEFKTQYKEWFSFVKKGNKLIKNNPSLLENDIFNPILSSTNYKDSLLEKFLSTKEAFDQVETTQNQMLISNKNKINMILILIHKVFYNSLVSCIIPNIFVFFRNKRLSFPLAIIILVVSIISKYASLAFFNIPNTKYIILISYIIYFIGSFFHILSCDSFFDEFLNFYRFVILIISRIFIGCGCMEAVSRNYIVLYSPKYYLIKISKVYSCLNFIGYALGALIAYILMLIPYIGNPGEIIAYTHMNSIGWYGVIVSTILFFIHIIFFTKENDEKFEMIKEQNTLKITIDVEDEAEAKKGNNKKDEKIILEKNDISESLLSNDKNENENIIEDIKENDTNKEDKINDDNKLIVEEKNENKEENKIKENDNNDNIINTNEKIDINEEDNNKENKNEENKDVKKVGTRNISIYSNNIDTGVNSAQVLSIQQKKLIKKLESTLDKFNEKSNFTNINLIPKNIDLLVLKEKNTFGYLKINLLIIYILLFISGLIQENVIFVYLYILNHYANIQPEYICLILSGIFLAQIVSLFFSFPLKKINIFIKRYLIIFMSSTIVFLSPLLYDRILINSTLILSLAVLSIVLFSNIIIILCSGYLSFLLPPRWSIVLGRIPLYIILTGRGVGMLICLFMEISITFNIIFIFCLCALVYGFVIGFLIIYKDFRIKIISRIIRKRAFEEKGI